MKNALKNKGKKLKLTTLGFTLIELLAVIVILAIVALIATPIILGIINDAKEQANKRSVEMYAKALENAIVKQQLNGSKPLIGVFETKNGREIFQEGNSELKLIVEYNGQNISVKKIYIYENGSIYLKEIKNNNILLAESYGKKQHYDNGDIVYFDVDKGMTCTKEEYEKSWDESTKDYLNSKTGYNGYTNKDESNSITSKLETQNSCLKFYAFLSDIGDKINLLLDHNTTALVAWTDAQTYPTSYPIDEGPIDIMINLKKDTNDWKGTLTPKNYQYKGNYSEPMGEILYTIDYSEYKARLITAQEVAQITKADEVLGWKEESSIYQFYFDGAKGTDPWWKKRVVGLDKDIKISEYYWLFDRTRSCDKYGGKVSELSNYGYWTSSAVSNSTHTDVWKITNNGFINGGSNIKVNHDTHHGLRPVIEVLKSSLLK